jgi:hypothetical protein
MSTTTWILLQIWVTGCVGGLMWLLVRWIDETWGRFAHRRHSRVNKTTAHNAREKSAASAGLAKAS